MNQKYFCPWRLKIFWFYTGKLTGFVTHISHCQFTHNFPTTIYYNYIITIISIQVETRVRAPLLPRVPNQEHTTGLFCTFATVHLYRLLWPHRLLRTLVHCTFTMYTCTGYHVHLYRLLCTLVQVTMYTCTGITVYTCTGNCSHL